jgi:hypothetical protein
MADFSLARSTSIGDPSSGPLASVRPESASLTAKQKRELVAELLKATPERSNRQIAAIAKVTHKVVAAVRRQMESTEQIAQLMATTGKDGDARTTRLASTPAGGATDTKLETNLAESERCEPKSDPAVELPPAAGEVGARAEAASVAPKSAQAPEIEQHESFLVADCSVDDDDDGDEERARRLKIEVDRLARLPTVERMFYLATEDYTTQFGVDHATVKKMVEIVVKEIEKKNREDKADQRYEQRRAEQKQEREELLLPPLR